MKTLLFSLAALAATTSFARAQDQGLDPKATKAPELSTSAGVDFTTHYFYRGISQENQGLIVQPNFDVSGKAAENLDFQVGFWGSIHDGDTGLGSTSGKPWYEADFFVNFDYAIQDLTLSVSYVVLDSPNGSFVTTQEAVLGLAYDDSGMYKGQKFGGFNPGVTIVRELDGGSDLGSALGTYLEVGISPSLQATDAIKLTLPIAVGFSLDDYYQDAAGKDNSVGFYSIGVQLETPVSYWTLTAGVQYLLLDGVTQAINGGDASEVVGSIGMSLSW